MKVVLIGKDDDFKQSFKKFLDSEGFSVENYSKITSFFPLTKNQFIIYEHSDINEEEALDIRKRFNKQLANGHFVFITSDKEQLVAKRLESMCANEIISKPVSHEYLLARVRSFFSRINSMNDNATMAEAAIGDGAFFSLLAQIILLRAELEETQKFKVDEFLRISNQLFIYLNQHSSRITGDKLTQNDFMNSIEKMLKIKAKVTAAKIRYKVDAKYFIFAFNDLIRNIILSGFALERISISANLQDSVYIMRVGIDAVSAFEVVRINEIVRSECWRNIMNLNNVDYSVQTTNDSYLIEFNLPFETY